MEGRNFTSYRRGAPRAMPREGRHLSDATHESFQNDDLALARVCTCRTKRKNLAAPSSQVVGIVLVVIVLHFVDLGELVALLGPRVVVADEGGLLLQVVVVHLAVRRQADAHRPQVLLRLTRELAEVAAAVRRLPGGHVEDPLRHHLVELVADDLLRRLLVGEHHLDHLLHVHLEVHEVVHLQRVVHEVLLGQIHLARHGVEHPGEVFDAEFQQVAALLHGELAALDEPAELLAHRAGDVEHQVDDLLGLLLLLLLVLLFLGLLRPRLHRHRQLLLHCLLRLGLLLRSRNGVGRLRPRQAGGAARRCVIRGGRNLRLVVRGL
mmetsp:Transcript_162/g.628  ORF Transcript_162/g.628 Transcript_162/m.628 type:complete len:322 (-) Transcript_162:136-1101(-)